MRGILIAGTLLLLGGCAASQKQVAVNQCKLETLKVSEALAYPVARTCMESKGYDLLWECVAIYPVPIFNVRNYMNVIMEPRCFGPKDTVDAYLDDWQRGYTPALEAKD